MTPTSTLALVVLTTALLLSPASVKALSGRTAADKPRTMATTSSYAISEGNPYDTSRFLDEGRERLESANFSEADPSMRLRQDLLRNYDNGDFPWTWAWNQSETPDIREGLPVEIGINFHKVFAVNVEKSLVDLVVWFRVAWQDPRLAWNPEDYGNLTTTWFFIKDGTGAGGETSEIWTPDIELWNMEISLQDSLTDTNAIVQSDGSVFWSRPGHMRSVCKFDGLDDFPFDSLSCKMEVGSWVYSGLYVRPIFMGDTGYTVGGSETAGEAFAEFSLQEVVSETYIYPPFPGAPEEDWPVIFYDVTFSRAWQPYARGYLILQIVLNIIGFCCFWIPPHVGERMSLAITALLESVASELVVASSLPQTSEITWFAKFTLGSLLFAAVVIFQSAIVIYFTYHVGRDLTPFWVKRMVRSISSEDPWPPEKTEEENEPRRRDTPLDRFVESEATPAKEESLDADGQGEPGESGEQEEPKTDSQSTVKEEAPARRQGSSTVSFGGLSAPSDDDEAGDSSSFYRPTRRSSRMRQFRSRVSMMSTPSNFTPSTRRGFKTVLGRDPDDFQNVGEMVHNYKWQQIAQSVDSFSRVFFPFAYGIFLVVSFTTGGYRL